MINGFLLIGQSNMAGRGDVGELDTPVLGKDIFMFRDGSWLPAEEPLHTDKPEIAGVGPGSGFALALREKFPGKKIGLIPCSMGGSWLDEWKQGTPLYEKALAAVKAAMNGPEPMKLKGVLWHQGEGDSNDPASRNSYEERFMAMYRHFTEDSGVCVPWVLGELGSYLPALYGNDGWQQLNEVFRRIVKNASSMALASSEGCTDKGDSLHFNTASQRIFGRRYAEKWLECSERAGIYLE